MTETKKRKAVYNPEADKRWREKNRAKVKHTNYLSHARTFIREMARTEDVAELEELLAERKKQLEDLD